MTLQALYLIGPLRIILDDETGEFLAAQTRTSGEAAAFTFPQAFISKAVREAQNAWASQAELA